MCERAGDMESTVGEDGISVLTLQTRLLEAREESRVEAASCCSSGLFPSHSPPPAPKGHYTTI